MIHSKPFDPDLSLDLVVHQPVRSLHSSNQAMHHQPITYILDLILHQICKNFSIPLPNDLLLPFLVLGLTQYHGPKPLRTNTRDPIPGLNTSDAIPRTKTIGLNTTNPKISFPTCTRFSVHESACICMRDF